MPSIKLTEEQLQELLSSRLVNCDSFVNTLYKYMPVGRVLELLEHKRHKIGFVSPEKWQDPYEIKYLNTDFTAFNGYKQPQIFCFCARKDNLNEEASWKIYKKENEPLLRLKINTLRFLLSIMNFAKSNKCDIFFSRVDYRLKKEEIDNLYLPSSPYYPEYFNDFDDKKYVKTMSIKRKAFEYENEYRIFIIPRDMEKVKRYMRKGVLLVPIDINAIINFTYYPLERIDDSLMAQIKKAKYDAECDIIRKRIEASYPNPPDSLFIRSTLYSDVDIIEKVEV